MPLDHRATEEPFLFSEKEGLPKLSQSRSHYTTSFRPITFSIPEPYLLLLAPFRPPFSPFLLRILFSLLAPLEAPTARRAVRGNSRANWPLLQWATTLPPRRERVTANLHLRSAGVAPVLTEHTELQMAARRPQARASFKINFH